MKLSNVKRVSCHWSCAVIVNLFFFSIIALSTGLFDVKLEVLWIYGTSTGCRAVNKETKKEAEMIKNNVYQ